MKDFVFLVRWRRVWWWRLILDTSELGLVSFQFMSRVLARLKIRMRPFDITSVACLLKRGPLL